METLMAQLIRHEGLRLKPYTDTVGKVTIGVGRNLTDCGISKDEAMAMLSADVVECVADLSAFGWWWALSTVRRNALTDMRFNLGPQKFRQFVGMLAALDAGDYLSAAEHMRDSLWARQLPRRVGELAAMMETGVASKAQTANV